MNSEKSAYHILIIEDEPAMLDGLKDNFEFEGYRVDVAPDGNAGFEKACSNAYDLIVSDVMMPGISGFDICRKLRSAGNKTPVILLTAKGQEIDKVLGLELGADDYITKPFGLRELLARVKAVIRRSKEGATKTSPLRKLGRLEVDFETFRAIENGVEIEMTHREFEVLQYLSLRPHQTVSRDELLSNVWKYQDTPTTRTVDNFILKLRQKLEPDPAHPRHILTSHGMGYKWVP
jgi:DNA-binding response OmpR family regulator